MTTQDVSQIMTNITTTETPVGDTNPIEVKTDAPLVVEDKKEDIDYVRRMQRLSKKEQELLKLKEDLKTQETDFNDYKSIKELAKTNPLALLEKFGISFDALVEATVNSKQSPEDSRFSELQKQIEDLKNQKENQAKAQEEAEQADRVQRFKQEIKNISKECGCELIETTDNYDMVFDICKEYYKTNGKLLDTKVAVEHVEKYLEQKLENMLKLQKVKTKLTPQQSQQTPQVNSTDNEFLLNRVVKNGLASSTPANDKDPSERRKKSLDIFTGKVNV